MFIYINLTYIYIYFQAKADVECAKLMRESSDILNSNSAMQIRFLETIQNISK